MSRPGERTPRRVLCWGTVTDGPVEGFVEAANAAGFHAVTLSPVRHRHLRTADPRALRSVIGAAGIGVQAIDSLIGSLPGAPRPGDVPLEHRPFFEDTEDEILDLADAVDAVHVDVAPFLGAPGRTAEFEDHLGRLAGRAAERGRRVALEFIPGTSIPDLATAAELVRVIGAPNLDLLIDSWHLARAGLGPDDLVVAAGLPIAGLQVCDRRGTEDPSAPMSGRELPGEGDLPLAETVDRILDLDPDAYVAVEVFTARSALVPVAEMARLAAESLDRVLAGHRGTSTGTIP